MSNCRRTVEQLALFVEGTLPPLERAEVERHLDECPPCRRVAVEAEGGHRLVRERAASLRHEALPPDLRSRCEVLARSGTPTASRPWLGGLATVAAIVVLLAVTASTLLALATRRSDQLLAQQLTLDHAKCFNFFADLDAAGANAHEAEQMLLSRFGWNVHVPPTSTSDDITLIGARRCLYTSGTIPHVMYRVNGAAISLFMLDGESRQADVTTLGHRSRMWTKNGVTYVLVSSAGAESRTLDQAERYVMNRASFTH
jgi:anti-sigma factor RsiW